MKQLLFTGICLIFFAGCSDSDNNVVAPALPDFTAADAWVAEFVATQERFPGGSYIVVDRDKGVIHKAVFGNQTEESLVLLASTSKVPTVTLLMAMHDDENINFDVNDAIANYLPWQGVWDQNITTQQLVANRSGIPGLGQILDNLAVTGSHLCQFAPAGTLYECAQSIYTSPLPGLVSTPAGTAFDYGGSQWQLSGAVAETAGGATWNQLWDQYIVQPCDLAIATFGNNLASAAFWDGNPESLQGLDNPNMEGGMMANLDDYAKLLSLHLNDGLCGDNRVMSAASVAFMRRMTTQFSNGGGYGMGWWLEPAKADDGEITLFTDAGAWGSLSWIDTERQYAGVVFFEEYTMVDAAKGSAGVRDELIPIIAEAIDAVRAD